MVFFKTVGVQDHILLEVSQDKVICKKVVSKGWCKESSSNTAGRYLQVRIVCPLFDQTQTYRVFIRQKFGGRLLFKAKGECFFFCFFISD